MKRFVCFLLTMVLIVSLVPGAVLTAFAASSLSTSNAAIEILKKMEGFRSQAYEDNGQWSIGYGTACDKDKYPNGINEAEATELLKEHLHSVVDPKLNDFAKKHNMTFTQNEHDALALITYNLGYAWMSNTPGYSTLYSAIVNEKTDNELIYAFCLYSSNGGKIDESLINRRLKEANMYLNNLYSNAVPAKYTYVRLLDSDGSVLSSIPGSVHGYDATSSVEIIPTPTKTGATFLGWYLEDGTPVKNLDFEVAKKTLYAKWQTDGDDYTGGFNYTINTSQAKSRDIFNGYTSSAVKLGTLKSNSVFTVTAEYVDAKNVKWVYGTGTGTAVDSKKTDKDTLKGWICMGEKNEEQDSDKVVYARATVTASTLNIRESALSDSDVVGSLKKDTVVNILGFKNENTSTGIRCWGKVYISGVYGWINLAYVSLEEIDSSTDVDTSKGVKGSVVNTDKVNIRSAAGTTNAIVTTLKWGTEVTVYEQVVKNNATWGRITWGDKDDKNEGWVYMYYIQLGSASEGEDSGSASTPLYTGVVNSTTNLNVRKTASVTGTWVTSLPRGTKINIYEKTVTNNVEWGRTDKGWVCLLYVTLSNNSNSGTGSDDTTTKPTTFTGTVTSSSLTVRKTATNNSEERGFLAKGETVQIVGQTTEVTDTGTKIWGKIVYKGEEGWINLAYVDVKAHSGSDNVTTGKEAKGVISNCITVNVRSNAGVSNPLVKTLKSGTNVTVYEQIEKDNAPWGRIDGGWVCMYYVTLNSGSVNTGDDDSSSGTVNGTRPGVISATGTVSSNTDLNVRAGAGLGYAKVGSLKKGTAVSVYEQVIADGMIWGKIKTGWICMSYITINNSTNTGTGVMGTIVKCFHAVNVRSAPGTGNALVGTILVGSSVEIYEQTNYNGTMWGRVAQGWISMDYVQLASEAPPITDGNGPTTAPTEEEAKPSETTKPEDETVAVGGVAFKCTVKVLEDLNVRKDATADAGLAGTLNANTNVNILSLKMNGNEVWGYQNEHDMPGWINLQYVDILNVGGFVQPETLAVYSAPNKTSTELGKLSMNDYVEAMELALNGSAVWVKVDIGVYGDPGYLVGWIPVNQLGARIDVIPVYDHTDNTGRYSKTFAETEVIADYQGNEVVFKLKASSDTYIQRLVADHGKIWGKVTVDGLTGWIDMTKVIYLWTLTVATGGDELNVRDTCEGEVIGTLANGASVNITSMMAASDGSIWGQLQTSDELNGGWVKMEFIAF